MVSLNIFNEYKFNQYFDVQIKSIYCKYCNY
jgi:hypothetical protein